MKNRFRLRLFTVLLSSCLPLMAFAGDNSPSRDPSTTGYGSPVPTTTQLPQYSNKCGIYSGVCPMANAAEVGSYCICNTPSGPIHGVVIP